VRERKLGGGGLKREELEEGISVRRKEVCCQCVMIEVTSGERNPGGEALQSALTRTSPKVRPAGKKENGSQEKKKNRQGGYHRFQEGVVSKGGKNRMKR